ncbi:MAG: heme lyase CcmF/NrfE family subunit, partial [Gemmatimonadaceae bacterium]
MILIGELSLWVALLMAAWGTTAGFAGAYTQRSELIASARRALYATCAFVVLAAAGLWTALLTSDFSFKFVASYTSANLPTVYKFTSFWAGQEGSLLLWALILSIYSSIAIYTGRKSNRGLMPWVVPTLSA